MTPTIPTGDGSAYAVPMSPDDHRSLAWVAGRYDSAAVLFDRGRYVANVMLVPEPVAFDYLAALPLDNGDPDAVVPPCVGGRLADALADLYDAIV